MGAGKPAWLDGSELRSEIGGEGDFVGPCSKVFGFYLGEVGAIEGFEERRAKVWL